MMKSFLRTPALLIFPALLSTLLALSAQMPTPAPGASTKSLGATEARAKPAWLDAAVVYEIFPRSFSPEGSLNGVTAKLDDLQKLGVSVLWLMPLHPVGQLGKRVPTAAPMRCATTTPSTRPTAPRRICVAWSNKRIAGR